MSASARLLVDRRRVLGPIDRRIYGQFVEHVGRVIYGGVFEPGASRADDLGYRTDVLEAARQLAPTVLRWPGGNFASGYHWRDGVGARRSRPTRHDLAWNAIETNAFGTEEFLELARRLRAQPYLNLNASTGTVDEALAWLAYCNAETAVPEVALRRAGPHPSPHDVTIWGIGNENYGWWQHGHTSASSYAEVAREWGKLLHWADPRIELIAVGAPSPDWNWTVLTEAGRVVDHLSLHCYWHGGGDDRYRSMLAGPIASERLLEGVWGMALEAQRKLELPRPPRLCVDEWGVWETTYGALGAAVADLTAVVRSGLSARAGIDTAFEESYDLKDALAVATWLHVLWRHPEKVSIATQAQMVNAIAPILTTADGVIRQTVFHPVAIARAEACPMALDLAVLTDEGDDLPVLDAAGTFGPTSGRLHLSLVNRARDDELEVTLEGVGAEARRIVLWHDDPFATNAADRPDAVAPREDKVVIDGRIVLAPHSHTTLVVA